MSQVTCDIIFSIILMVIIISLLYFIDGDITQIVTSFSRLYLSERAGVNIILYNT